MLTAVMLFLLLEAGVNQPGYQKKLVFQFIQHPWRVEGTILILFLWMPVSFGYSIYTAVLGGADPQLLSILVMLVIGFPVMAYFLHMRISDFKSKLGIGQKIEHDPILKAKVAVVCWLISVGSFIVGAMFMLTDTQPHLRFILSGLGSLGAIMIPFRESLATIRNQDEKDHDM